MLRKRLHSGRLGSHFIPAMLVYHCPHCEVTCSVDPAHVGGNVVCPSCSGEFVATPPSETEPFRPPERLPFFKSGRIEILEQEMRRLIADGEMSPSDESALINAAVLLELDIRDLHKLMGGAFNRELEPIIQRISKTAHFSDEDEEACRVLQKKYGVDAHFEGDAAAMRLIYRMEVKDQLPPPSHLPAPIFLESGERLYRQIQTTWSQTRSRTVAYRGVSVSVPLGIRGVRYRFGSYQPIRAEELTPLDSGPIFLTNQHLIFQGSSRTQSTAIEDILDVTVYADSFRIDRKRGRSDFFLCPFMEARFAQAFIGVIRRQAG